MFKHLPTLLLREWMQHKRGWLIAMLAPALLFMAMLPIGDVQGMPQGQPELLTLATLLLAGIVTWGICLMVAVFQLPGLARRDVQDRSIEFWLSLPGGHGESLLATLLAHGWLAPLAGLAVGTLLGFPIVVLLVGLKVSWGALGDVAWSQVLAVLPPLWLRAALGTLLTLVWMAPLVLVLMAASAWLKRIGVPLVLGGGGVAMLIMNKVYGIEWPSEQMAAWTAQLNKSMVTEPNGLSGAMGGYASPWVWAGQDALAGLSSLVSLQALGWAAIAGVAFWLLVLKRSRIA
ncbi:hypothetical protein [Roseateles sp.]|uniref:hypothetical protein n=1 Tax=Roseateles sp. TaxID=1971397 RepID=UPI00393BE677